jgi:hypothetical protein
VNELLQLNFLSYPILFGILIFDKQDVLILQETLPEQYFSNLKNNILLNARRRKTKKHIFLYFSKPRIYFICTA